MQNQIILNIPKFINLRKNLVLETEYFMKTSRNLRNTDRNRGTVEKRASFRKTFIVTFAKCSEAKILNDLQPEQSQDKLLILDSVGN